MNYIQRIPLRTNRPAVFRILLCMLCIGAVGLYSHYMTVANNFSQFTWRDKENTKESDVAHEQKLASGKELYYAEDDDVARHMYKTQRVLCWIMTGPANHQRKSKHVKETWGKRCNILLFLSTENDDTLPTVKLPLVEGRKALWGKTKQSLQYVWENYGHEADWFLKADDDTYVIVENLRYFVSMYNTSDGLYIGHKFKMGARKGFMSGGASYVLSKEALKRFVEREISDPGMCNPGNFGPEDYFLGECLDKLGLKAIDTRDSYGRQRFLPLKLDYFIPGEPKTKKHWYWRMNYYPVNTGEACCSDTLIGLHYVTPAEMHIFDYLIYHLHPYGILNFRSSVQSIPGLAPDHNLTDTPFPGPSEEDEKIAEQYQKEKEILEKRITLLEESAKLLDANETLRNTELERRTQN